MPSAAKRREVNDSKMSALHQWMHLVKVVGEGDEGTRGRRGPVPLPQPGGRRARAGSRGRAAGWEVGSRVAWFALRRPPAPRVLREAGRVLPALGTLGRVPRGELGSFGPPAERAGPGAGGARSCGVFLVGVREPNVQLTESQRPISSGGIFFLSFLSSPLGKCTVQVRKVEEGGCQDAYTSSI